MLGNDNPAWPYTSPHVPSPGDAEGMERVKVLIGVFTVAKSKARRMLIRETYTRQRVEGVKWMFMLGKPEGRGVKELQEEAERMSIISVVGRSQMGFAIATGFEKHNHVDTG